MKRVEITDVHPRDAYHNRKDEFLGLIVDGEFNQWQDEHGSVSGWWEGEANDLNGKYYNFMAIKFEVLDEMESQ